MTSISVSVYNTQRRFPVSADAIKSLAQSVITLENRTCHEVAIHFVGTKKICSLHATYFNDPSVTDCISFPIHNQDTDFYIFLGEVFVCPETAYKYVCQNGGNLYEEIALYTVHGLLHLMGYDDIKENDQMIMREREKFHMQHLKKAGIPSAIPAEEFEEPQNGAKSYSPG